MVFIFGVILNLCNLSFSKSIHFQIDGRLDLGNKWTYEYNIQIPDPILTTIPIKKQGEIINMQKARAPINRHEKNTKSNELTDRKKKRKNSKRLKEKTSDYKSHKEKSIERKGEKHHKRHDEPRDKKKKIYDTMTENEFNIAAQFKNNLRLALSNSSKIKYNKEINTFTSNILREGLEIFENIKKKTTGSTLIKKLDMIAASYENKFKKFLKETSRHDIKTRLGTQKVILNAIDISDRILKRLVNYLVVDLHEKDNLYLHQSGIASNLQHEVVKKSQIDLKKACKTFGVCRSGAGFSEFLNEFFSIILKSDDSKFKQAIDSLTEVTKNMNFNDVFPLATVQKLNRFINRIEKFSVSSLRPGLMILKNIIKSKNKPIVLPKSEVATSSVNSTLAIHEIIDIFGNKLPRNDANILKWGELRVNLKDWADNNRFDIQEIIASFMDHIKSALDDMPSRVQKKVAVNFERVIKH